jgi:hypothetical protein
MKLIMENLLEKTVHFKAGGLIKECSFICIKETALCIVCNERQGLLKRDITPQLQTILLNSKVYSKVQPYNQTVWCGSGYVVSEL